MIYPETPPGPSAEKKKRPGLRLLAIVGAVIVLAIIGLIALGSAAGKPKHAASTPGPVITSPVTTAPVTPAPVVPSPNATGSGQCDTSLSPSLNGPNYLVASVQVTNTGNIGEVTRVKVAWPQEGFPSIVRHTDVRLNEGASTTVNLRVSSADYPSQDIIGNFQNVQLNDAGNDPCNYSLGVQSTFGTAH
jgi:hypothetical protein